MGRMNTVGIINHSIFRHTGKDFGKFSDKGCLLGGISLARDFRCLLIGETNAVQQVYNPLGRVLHAECGLYPLCHTLGIRIDMLTKFLAQGGQLSAVKKPPITFVAVFQKFIGTAVQISGTVTVYGETSIPRHEATKEGELPMPNIRMQVTRA